MSREREFDARELPRERPRAKFALGKVVATPGALAALTQDDLQQGLGRHQAGDWGDLDDDDRASNDRALIDGTRLLSAYKSACDTKFWIITEWDRSVTTVLLPDEY